MQLLDAYGRPVKRAALTQPQAQAGITGVRQPYANSVAYGLTPQRLAAILKSADQGDIVEYAKLAEEMEERDPHYASVLGVRKRAVSGVDPVVEPASESARDREIATAVEETIAADDTFPDLVEDLLDGLGKGFSVVEIDWRKTATRWWPEAYEWRSQRHFKFDKETGTQLRLIDEADMADGIELAPFKFAVHRPKLKSGLSSRAGVARLVAFSWICKAYSMKDWMAFVECYGLPLRLGRYGPEATREDVEKLYLAVANIGTDAAAVLPKSMEIEFEHVSSGGDKPVFENLARFIDQQVSKAVLGQTMTSDDGSSMAQAQVHDGVRHDIAQADARQVSATINRDIVKPFVDLNFGVQARYPRLRIVVEEPEDVKLAIEGAAKLVPLGLKIRQSEVRAKLRFTDPDDDDDLLGAPATTPPAATPPAPPPAADAEDDDQDVEDEDVEEAANRGIFEPAPGSEFDPFATTDEIEAEMLAEWEEVVEETLGPIEAALAEATDYEDFRRRLAGIRELPAGLLIDGLVKGLFKARSMGDQRDG